MREEKSNRPWLIASLLFAISSSLCCATPILVALGFISGMASTLSVLRPFRPYAIILAVIFLGFAFYQAYKPEKAHACECDGDEGAPGKKKFIRSKGFLWLIAVLCAGTIAFPYYGGYLISKSPAKTVMIVKEQNIRAVKLDIPSMRCEACEGLIDNALLKQNGVIGARTSYGSKSSVVKFDSGVANLDGIIKAVDSTGYKVERHTWIDEK